MNLTANTARVIETGTIVVITTGSTKTKDYRQVAAKVTGQTFVAIPGTEFGVWKTVAVTADSETITDHRVRPATTEEADAFTAAVTPAPVVWPAAPRFVAWFVALVDQNLECTDTEAFERTAYRGHIGYNLSMTDGYYAPEDFDRWVIGFRIDPAGALYYGNDARHALAPTVRSYTAQLSA
jgi:hypothetical protein